jgi:hypothetical protein
MELVAQSPWKQRIFASLNISGRLHDDSIPAPESSPRDACFLPDREAQGPMVYEAGSSARVS